MASTAGSITRMVDSYTGFSWCGRTLHLLSPENTTSQGKCLACKRAADLQRAHSRRTARSDRGRSR